MGLLQTSCFQLLRRWDVCQIWRLHNIQNLMPHDECQHLTKYRGSCIFFEIVTKNWNDLIYSRAMIAGCMLLTANFCWC